jgi:hypothetical protein
LVDREASEVPPVLEVSKSDTAHFVFTPHAVMASRFPNLNLFICKDFG